MNQDYDIVIIWYSNNEKLGLRFNLKLWLKLEICINYSSNVISTF